MANGIDGAVEAVLRHKAGKIAKAAKYGEFIRKLLDELGVRDTVHVWKLGAIDAMIYDVACALDFTKQKGHVSDWSAYKKREFLIRRIWKEMREG